MSDNEGCLNFNEMELQVAVAWFPVHSAQSTGLKCLKNAKRFFYTAAYVVMVNNLIFQFAFWIDDVQAAQSNAFFFDQNTVVSCYVLVMSEASGKFNAPRPLASLAVLIKLCGCG